MTQSQAVTATARRATGASLTRHALTGLRVLLAFTLLVGVAYPLAMTGASQLLFGWRADGSLVRADGSPTRDRSEAVGSALLSQSFEGPEWFRSRPSAAGDGFDPLSSGGTNLGPESPELVGSVRELRAEVAATEGVDVFDVPADAVTSSASGLDPHISPAYAELQVPRVARARGLPEEVVRELVADHSAGRSLGVLGDPRVDVLGLNIALDRSGRTIGG
ncbi:K+-transporting ATPase ATPase C chain [Isoptericola sp. CG 20/1183]|uniref:Potassium-transporting ATPase KdpC subunit n=1 Tax=Isoptericola halotolerans TaxID=300560 RepID=A0ABX5EHH7_9MICO|nr:MULTISPECIES: potassium-transporting ATPase subunit KdpC [Isoptericola]PRZ02935.1 K+-transporting ATPase ATPase C chain [Isoptericola sp. CG 20/1183]PRZ09932.1 K+-transporting ATPase ATPase C chain [Isoptericola halotolerans]